MTRTTRPAFPLVLVVAVAACAADHHQPARNAGTAPAAMPPAAPAHVDSVFPIEEELRRFRAASADAPDRLRRGRPDREALVRAFVAALEAADTAALAGMVLDRAEFAYLYYPYTRFTRPPYELSPGLLWLQIRENGHKGIVRALRDHGGRPLRYVGHRCDPEPERARENRTWAGCVLRRRLASGDVVEIRLFGSILERDGVFKFVSYANKL